MDPDRRDLLKVLGVLGVGGAGSALLLSGGDGGPSSGVPETASDAGTPTTGGRAQSGSREDYAAAVERVGSDLTEPPSLPEPTRFDYDPVDVSFEERWLGRFVASPADGGEGDRMRATPGTGSPDEVLTTFHRWLGLPDERWGEATLAGETVELRGGAADGRVAVLGTVDSRDLVVVARAVDEATLDGIVSSWGLPES
ncbi:hypothetical protein [Halosimplex marinum]|uniref:hypothetical protein n=1 Tax=Halosimplex marinum TaxID=3396620 RepID=UPI003F54D700